MSSAAVWSAVMASLSYTGEGGGVVGCGAEFGESDLKRDRALGSYKKKYTHAYCLPTSSSIYFIISEFARVCVVISNHQSHPPSPKRISPCSKKTVQQCT
jgi:hypothetical protein